MSVFFKVLNEEFKPHLFSCYFWTNIRSWYELQIYVAESFLYNEKYLICLFQDPHMGHWRRLLFKRLREDLTSMKKTFGAFFSKYSSYKDEFQKSALSSAHP
jgi:hypothetical protein